MTILQTISGMSAQGGGTSTCTYDLLGALNAAGCRTDLMTVSSPDLLGRGETWMRELPAGGTLGGFAYSPHIRRFLRESDYDVYHTNGLWMYCNHATCRAARRKDRPYIITPHGMLYPQALARSAWKKRLMRALLFDGHLRRAACLHATCRQELDHIRALGFRGPVAVIPNPCPLPPYIGEITPRRSRPRIGYLGRLHPYKQPDVLIRAWAESGAEAAGGELVVMGAGTPAYEASLRALVQELGLRGVTFAGMVTGRRKFETLATLTALCVPSRTENFGLTVAEALMAGTPVICTRTAPWQDLELHRCGWWTGNDVPSLTAAIRHALSLPPAEIEQMGRNGRRLIEQKYSDREVARQMRELYEWVGGTGEKPESVFSDK